MFGFVLFFFVPLVPFGGFLVFARFEPWARIQPTCGPFQVQSFMKRERERERTRERDRDRERERERESERERERVCFFSITLL